MVNPVNATCLSVCGKNPINVVNQLFERPDGKLIFKPLQTRTNEVLKFFNSKEQPDVAVKQCLLLTSAYVTTDI